MLLSVSKWRILRGKTEKKSTTKTIFSGNGNGLKIVILLTTWEQKNVHTVYVKQDCVQFLCIWASKPGCIVSLRHCVSDCGRQHHETPQFIVLNTAPWTRLLHNWHTSCWESVAYTHIRRWNNSRIMQHFGDRLHQFRLSDGIHALADDLVETIAGALSQHVDGEVTE